MNKFTKKQMLIGGLVLLIVINLAALGTFIYQNYQARNDQTEIPPPSFRDQGRNFQRGVHENRFPRFLKDRLNLTDNQYEQFRNLRTKTRTEQQSIRNEIHKEMDKMMEELASNNPDRDKLNKINEKIGNLHQELNQVLIDHFMETRNIFDRKQRKEMNKLIREIPDHRNRPRHQRHMQERPNK